MNKIDLQAPKEQDFNYSSMFEESAIDFETDIKEQPIAIQCGTYTVGEDEVPLSFGSYGDFSCIVGPSKTMKSTLLDAIIACCIGGNSNNYFDNFKGVGMKDKWVLVLDTEQSKYHVKRNANIIQKMVGFPYKKYKSFALRKYSVEQRVGFLKWLVKESDYAGNIGLVAVDGAADLVKSVNDELASYALAQLFMELTAEEQIHLITVLHKNSQGGKPTGHLGSAIQKKAETVMFLGKGKSEGWVKATSKNARNKDFQSFEFMLNNEEIPVIESIVNSKLPF